MSQVIPSLSYIPLHNAQGQLYVYTFFHLTNTRNVFPEDKGSQEANLPIRYSTYAAFLSPICQDNIVFRYSINFTITAKKLFP
jgi:hypothetical protein